jgi:hypothetical protein
MMRPLSAHDVLEVWEQGQGQHSCSQALIMLAAADPEATREELAALSVGQRDARLLTLRELTFGAILNAFAECPQCEERLEFTVAVPDIRMASPPPQGDQTLELATEGWRLWFRQPNSGDLAALIGCGDADTARRILVQRCVLQASRDGMPVPCSELPAEAISKVAARMAECDPQADVLFDLDCPWCGRGWQMIFDIASFLWAEICAQAKRLLREVHTLARAYGWREVDILSMSATRRQWYLGMVT